MRTVVLCLVVSLLVASPAFADGGAAKKKAKRGGDEQILEDLERGVRALEKLGRHEEAEHLLEILRDVASDMKAKRHREEDEHAAEWKLWAGRTKVMKLAVPALIEGERGEQAERLEHGIHAIELALEGRHDAEAREIRESAPKIEEMIELLGVGAELLHHFGDVEKSKKVGALFHQLRKEARGHEGAAKKKFKKPATMNQLEVYRLGMEAMAEAERPRELEVMERAVLATEVIMEGRQDEEARQIKKKMPDRESIVEVLRFAGRLYDEWGHPDRAEICMKAAERILHEGGAMKRRAKGPKVKVNRRKVESDEHTRELEERLEMLQDQIQRLANELEEIAGEIKRRR